MKTQQIFNLRSRKPTAVAITGDHSSMSVYATNDLVEQLGGIEATFHEIKRLQGKSILPRMGSESKPLTLLDIRYARENEERGERYWQWIQETSADVRESTGYDSVHGYGHKTTDGFVLIDGDGSVAFSVKRPITPHKGGRTEIVSTARVTPKTKTQLQTILDQRGISYADWITEMVARESGR